VHQVSGGHGVHHTNTAAKPGRGLPRSQSERRLPHPRGEVMAKASHGCDRVGCAVAATSPFTDACVARSRSGGAAQRRDICLGPSASAELGSRSAAAQRGAYLQVDPRRVRVQPRTAADAGRLIEKKSGNCYACAPERLPC
jgi:hypothetical protein